MGASFLTLMPELLRSLSDYRYIFYGVVLVAMVVFRPQGLLGGALRGARRSGTAAEGA